MRPTLALLSAVALSWPGLALTQAPAPGDAAKPPGPATGNGPATPATPAPSTLTVLAEVVGTVKELDRSAHRLLVDASGETVTVTLDRNTMVYTSRGLGTVLDIEPGAQVRVGRNAKFLAYWVQVRPTGAASDAPVSTPGQGSSPTTGAGPPAEGGGVAPPSGTSPGGGSTTPGATPGPGR